MTKSESPADLARRVYTTIYNGCESFHGIGDHIAYLIGGILTENGGMSLYRPLEEDEDEFYMLLSDLFAPEDEIWKHITLECDQLGNGCTCESCTKQITDALGM